VEMISKKDKKSQTDAYIVAKKSEKKNYFSFYKHRSRDLKSYFCRSEVLEISKN
jgi:hypothetical protein